MGIEYLKGVRAEGIMEWKSNWIDVRNNRSAFGGER